MASRMGTTTRLRVRRAFVALVFLLGSIARAASATPAVNSLGDYPIAARGARFVTNAAGETRIFLRGAEGTLEVSSHAAQRITQRGVSLDAVEEVIGSQKPFQYFHNGVSKTGLYDPASRLFVGSVDGTITTVIPGATPNYINNLMGALP